MTQDRLDIFEKVLLLYGEYVLLNLYSSAKVMERYEDCAIMRDLMKRHNIDERNEIQDWQAYKCIYNHRTTKTNQKYPSVNL